MMELTDDEKDRDDDNNLSNNINSRKEKGHTDFASPDTNNSGGDTDILSQTTDDSSESELESGQLVLKKARTAKKQLCLKLFEDHNSATYCQWSVDGYQKTDIVRF